MATGTLHAIKNTGATLSNTGWVINQTAVFRGLSPVENSIAGLISAAYNVLLTNNYYIGKFLNFSDVDYLTGEQWPIILDQFDFSTLSQDSQEVRIVWRSRRNGPIRVQFSTGAVMEQTNKDVNGNPIVVKYTYPDDAELYGEKAGKEEETGAMVDILYPERTIEVTRTEWGPTYGLWPGDDISQILWQRKFNYEKHVNDASWHPILNQIPIPSLNKHCWLCTGIQAATNDNGVTYDVSYTFVFREPIDANPMSYKGGWSAESVFIDPGTGRPPKDLVDDEGYVVSQIYPEADFSQIWIDI